MSESDTFPICVLNSGPIACGGAEPSNGQLLNVSMMIKAIIAQGVHVVAFTRREAGMEPVHREDGLTVYAVEYLRSGEAHPMLRDYRQGLSFVRSVLRHPHFWPHRYRCIHTHHWTAAISLAENLPDDSVLVHTPHLLAMEKGRCTGLGCPNAVASAEKKILQRATHVIALSLAEAAAIAEIDSESRDRTHIIANGVDESFIGASVARERSTTRPVRILSVGRLCTQKGIDVLLDALALLRNRGRKIELQLAGGSYGEPEYEKLIRGASESEPLNGRVSFMGTVPHTDLPTLMAAADVYVQPSRYESQCIALLEAMGAGCLVVASRLPAIEEYIRDGQNGFLADVEDAASLADSIERAISLPTNRSSRVCMEARLTARQYSWEKTARLTLDLLLSCGRSGLRQTLPSGETHDSALQAHLADTAEKRAKELILLEGVRSVFLTGSTAKGPTHSSSDLDLHVVVEAPKPELPPWQFKADGVVENIHQVCLGEVLAVCGEQLPDAIAAFHFRTMLGDEMFGCRKLASNLGTSEESAIQTLLGSRLEPRVVVGIARRYSGHALALLNDSRRSEAQSPLDAEQFLRLAAQKLLIACLVRVGWIVRGAKKRPEIASGYAENDTLVALALEVLQHSIGLDRVDPRAAEALCKRRLSFRFLYISALEELHEKCGKEENRQRIAAGLAFARRHNEDATDYYSGLLDQGMFRGPVNHIRALSRFSEVPAQMFEFVEGKRTEHPIGWLLEQNQISPRLGEEWFGIAGFERSPSERAELRKNAEGVIARLESRTGSSSLAASPSTS